jgi:cysteine synthase
MMRLFLVSSFLADVTQQIHSLRAKGVISAQAAFATGSAAMALWKSAGILCGNSTAVSFLAKISLAQKYNFDNDNLVPILPEEGKFMAANFWGGDTQL